MPDAHSLLVLHVPHCPTVIPESVRSTFLLTEAEVQKELLQLTDWYTDELFHFSGAASIRHPVSRIVVDPERFEDDANEVMAQSGMGVIYTDTCDERPLRHVPTPSDRETLLAAYYRPHHAASTDAVARALREHGRCLVIDCHSFPSNPLPFELDQRLERPDICIGTDPFHTPTELADEVLEGFRKLGYSVALNRPFAGALVPATFFRSDANVSALMIEVNRSLYMDEGTGAKSSRFDEIRAAVAQVLAHLVSLLCMSQGL